MKGVFVALILSCSVAFSAHAAEPPAEKIELKDGSMLFLHPDGTARMVDVHGKPMSMSEGVEMETANGEIIVMMNKKVWVEYGPPGKGARVLKTD